MGMYTEVFVKLSLVENVDQSVVEVLKYMMGYGTDGEVSEKPDLLPDHPLFSTSRWDFMLQSSSFYHIPERIGQMFYDKIAGQWFIVNRSDFKNYENEAELFFDWIKPYTEYFGKTFVGYTLYEECDKPTLIYFGE